jgi:hypothetical protein
LFLWFKIPPLKFRTEVHPEKSDFSLQLNDSQVFVGSCFSEHMSGRLSDLGMDVTANPHGILFNPVSVARCLTDLMESKVYSEEDLDLFNDNYISFFHHGSFSGKDKSEVLNSINKTIESGSKALKEAQTLFITFGTSWGYRHVEKNEFVANCHKVPQKAFKKELITHDRMLLVFNLLLEKLFEFNESLQIVLTISPVRHWKDGVSENQLSKSHLTIASHILAQAFERVHYFPAYEIVMDDLRDYRFFESDLLHPNKQAQDYIWEKFQGVFFSESDKEKIERIEKINKSLAHVPAEENEEYKEWREKLLDEKKNILR